MTASTLFFPFQLSQVRGEAAHKPDRYLLPGTQLCVQNLRQTRGQVQKGLLFKGFGEEGSAFLLQAGLCSLPEGRHAHTHIVSLGLEHEVYLANLLIRMYAKCGHIDVALSLFSKLQHRDLVTWNTMLGAYAQEDKQLTVLCLFEQMKVGELDPDAVSYLITLKACSSLFSLGKGVKIHALIVNGGFESNLMIGTALVDMYGRCGLLDQGTVAFNKIHVLDVAAWNAIIGAHTQCGFLEESLSLFVHMQVQGLKPNKITYVHALGACVSPEKLEAGKLIHACIIEDWLEADVILSNALLTMYGKCGNLENAFVVFDKIKHRTVVSWTAIITECSRQGCNREALNLFYKMQEEGMQQVKVTFVSAISACTGLESIIEGKEIHILATHRGFESDVSIGSALTNMYGKWNHVLDARAAFCNISEPNVVSWNAMIAAYAQQGLGNEALEAYRQMKQEGLKPDKVTFISTLTAVACTRSLNEGRDIHNCILEYGLKVDVVLGNALIDMYGKCAALEWAQSTFESMDVHNVITWTTLIAAYAQLGHGKTALDLYKRMQDEGVKPNKATYSSLLSACSHAGLVEEGCFYFGSMTNEYNIEPDYEHYGSMVDLYGRAGLLKEAEDLIGKMPFEADACIWTAVLGACEMHGDASRAKLASEKIARLESVKAP